VAENEIQRGLSELKRLDEATNWTEKENEHRIGVLDN